MQKTAISDKVDAKGNYHPLYVNECEDILSSAIRWQLNLRGILREDTDVSVRLHQEFGSKRVILNLSPITYRDVDGQAHSAYEDLPQGFPGNLIAGAPTFRRDDHGTGDLQFSAATLSDMMKGVNSWLRGTHKLDTTRYTAIDLAHHSAAR